MSLIALGLDPGFAFFGWAVVDLADDTEELLELGVIRTKKAKGKVLVRDDEHRRVIEIVRGLLQVINEYEPDVFCAEALSHVNPGAGKRMPVSTMTKMGRTWGVVTTLSELLSIALLQTSAQSVKKATAGPGASKVEVQAALDERFDGAVAEALAGIRAKTQHEHPVDALGAVVACLDHDHLRLARAACARVAS